MKAVAIKLLTPIIALFFAGVALAQGGGAESVFRSQVIDLHSKAIIFLERIEKTGPRDIPRAQMRDEIFALVRLTHRLQEEAGSTNVDLLKRGDQSSKVLLLVQQASISIDAMLAALDNYIESGDRAFLGFARDNNALVWSVRKVM